MFRVLLKLIALILFLAHCLFGVLTLGSYLRYANRDQYKDESFYVTGAAVTGRHGSQPFLEGKIQGSREVLIDPSAPSMPWPDYLKRFPIGTQIPVKFNPAMTAVRFQYQSVRVLKRDWRFEDDLQAIRLYLAFIAIPTALTAAAFYATRKSTPDGRLPARG